MSLSCIQILRFNVRGIGENDWLPLVVILHKARNTRCEDVSTSLKRAGLLNVGVMETTFAALELSMSKIGKERSSVLQQILLIN